MKKIYIDSNIFIRLLTSDVKNQFLEAYDLLKKIENTQIRGSVSILVINEVIWILENYYELKRNKFMKELVKLLALKNIQIVEIRKERIMQILSLMVINNIDFTDLYLKEIAGKEQIFSFDRDFQKIIKN